MSKNTFLLIFYSLMINFSLSAITNYWHNIKSRRNINNETAASREKNESNFIELMENVEVKNTKKNILFWAPALEANSSTETILTKLEIKNNDYNKTHKEYFDPNIVEETQLEINGSIPEDKKMWQYMNKKHTIISNENQTFQIIPFQMEQEILLLRNNCYLELDIDKRSTLKVQIKFDSLRNYSFGKCFITLNGHKESRIAIILSHIHLYYNKNDFSKEILKVIVNNDGVNFIIKEYFGNCEHQPILLTETHRVYMILHYNVTTVNYTENYSEFNLEVFNYNKNSNAYKNMKYDNDFSNLYFSSLRQYNIKNIFLTTTEKPHFSLNKYF